MANRRVLVKRRKAVRNIRKITRTMQLIATARFQAAFNRATATKPYTDQLSRLISNLARATGGARHPLQAPPEGASGGALLVITSNRGLCGGYNANVLRVAQAFAEDRREEGEASELHVFGKKGIAYFRFVRRAVASAATQIGDTPRFEQVEPLANDLMRRFLAGEVAAVHVAFMRFFSAGQQRPEIVQLLPLSSESREEKAAAGAGELIYEFRPGAQELLDELLPAAVRMRLFQCFTDAAVSEQVARMVAMKAATESAGEMITTLTRQYNRARQTQITMELLDIVGGANALS